MQNARLEEAQAGIKIARRNTSNLRYPHDTTLMLENKERLKSLLMKVKEEHEKAGLKFNIQNTKIMAFSPITSWQIDGETMETVTDFTFLGSKITAAMKLKMLPPRKKSYDQPREYIKKQRHHFANKGLYSQSEGFSIVMYGSQTWTIKKTEH